MRPDEYLNETELKFLSTIFTNLSEWWIKGVESMISINQQIVFMEHPSGLSFQYTRKIND